MKTMVLSGGYPLTHPQKRIWYIEKMYPATSMFNIGGIVRIEGGIDFDLLIKAIRLFVQQNEGVRLRLREEHGVPMQYVEQQETITVPFLDFSTATEPEAALFAWSEAEFTKPFELLHHPLFAFAVFKVHEYQTGYLAKLHHIIADGWSMRLLTDQISEIYTHLQDEEEEDSKRPSYLEYLEIERQYLASERFVKDKAFWRQQFQSLPESFLTRSSYEAPGRRKLFALSADLSQEIRSFIRKCRVSLNSLFVLVVLLYQYKSTQHKEHIIGHPVLNRSGAKERQIFGMFTSTMPFRFAVQDDLTLVELLKQVDAEERKCFFHQKYPYDLLLHDLELRKKGYEELFQVSVNYYHTQLVQRIGSHRVENLEFYSGLQIYSLQIAMKDWLDTGEISLFFDYKINDYQEVQIDHLYHRLLYLLEQLLRYPDQTVHELSLLSPQEKDAILYGRNQTTVAYPEDSTIHLLFEKQVEETPERIAVCCQTQHYTYRVLNEHANQLARLLRKKGIGPEQIVGLLATHSCEMLVALWAILKAGAAYLPIDPSTPSERVAFLLEDSHAVLLLTNLTLEPRGFTGEILHLQTPSLYQGETTNLTPINQSSDLVYVIYTSGSTGLPKGTLIEHRNLINYVSWTKRTYIRSQDEAFALYSSLAFDLTVTSIFPPLLNGNQVVVYQDTSTDYLLHTILQEARVSVVKTTPAHLALVQEGDYAHTSVTRLIVGGEDLKGALVHKLFHTFGPQLQIYNEYGPTETVVGCTAYAVDATRHYQDAVPIGQPIDNVHVYVLDEQLQPVPDGIVGEIYISGTGVARGYLSRPELTQARFLDNPFVPGTRMYKTGDLARFRLSDGCDAGELLYVGRSDQQVKIKGYRIELGEIEDQLLRHPLVQEAVVIDLTEANGYKYLCGYVVLRSDLAMYELRKYLIQALPAYMIPAYLLALPRLPLTTNGKVDRERLPHPMHFSARSDELEGSVDTAIVETLLTTLRDLLQVEAVHLDDNFYQLGGDSIKAMQLVTQLQQQDLHIALLDIMANPVVHTMARAISLRPPSFAPQVPATGMIPPSPISEWFFAQHAPDPQYWHQSVLLHLHRSFPVDHIRSCLTSLVHQHDALRIQLTQEELAYCDAFLQDEADLLLVDLRQCSTEVQRCSIKQIGSAHKANVHLSQGWLFKAVLFQLAEDDERLLLIAHHLVVDGVSWRILLEDLSRLLLGEPLPPKTHSLQIWTAALNEYSREQVLSELPYWQGVLTLPPFMPELTSASTTLAECETLALQLSQEETQQLLSQANTPYQTSTHELLLIALACAIQSFNGRSDVLIEMEGHGREPLFADLDLTHTVGWFTSIYPLALHVPDGELPAKITSLKEQIRSVPNKGIGYGILKYLSGKLERETQRHLRFNYLGELDNMLANEVFSLAEEDTGPDISSRNPLSCLMDVLAQVKGKRLHLSLLYSRQHFSPSDAQMLFDAFMAQLRVLIHHCSAAKTPQTFTPSDFDTLDLTQADLDELFEFE